MPEGNTGLEWTGRSQSKAGGEKLHSLLRMSEITRWWRARIAEFFLWGNLVTDLTVVVSIHQAVEEAPPFRVIARSEDTRVEVTRQSLH